MNLDALHERISEWFEPKPALKPEHLHTAAKMLRVLKGNTWRGTTTDKGAWWWNGDMWQPINYTHDEAANARLLEVIEGPVEIKRVVMNFREPWEYEWRITFRHRNYPHNLLHYEIYNSDRKTAIQDAFCKWAGIELEST